MDNNRNVLELTGIAKTFGSGESRVDALVDIDFHVQAGELVALIGPSGSGKSTLLAIAGALLTPTTGRVMLDGVDITAASEGERAKVRLERIGFVFQGSNLISYLTAREQLLFIGDLTGMSRAEAGERADRLLTELGMSERANHYPEAMSGGQRQRIAIGRALMNDPRLILADEPTASLDSSRARKVVSLLGEEVRERGKAGVLVTHDERLIDLCDRVVHIADGRLAGAEATSVATAS